jgi:hypothetical protein
MTRRGSIIQALAALTLLVAVVVAWVDPRPQPDSATGARMRLTVAGDCPASDAGMVGVEFTDTDLIYRMVPDATPTAALVCRYDGQTRQLAAIQRLDAGQAGVLQAALRQTTLDPPWGGVVNCGADDGSAIVMAFSYADLPDADLWFEPAGCSFVANGLIVGRPVGLAEALAVLG